MSASYCEGKSIALVTMAHVVRRARFLESFRPYTTEAHREKVKNPTDKVMHFIVGTCMTSGADQLWRVAYALAEIRGAGSVDR
jgi:hypothetical protein